MPLKVLFLLGFTLLGRAWGESYITFPSDVDWMQSETAHFRIVFRRGEERLAERTLAAAEKAHSLIAPIFDETPPRTWIVLADFHDSLNGYAIDFPWPHMVIFAAPPEPSGQLSDLDSWLESVVLHEYVHVVHLYPANGLWSALRTVFGYWILPNAFMPSHLHEGMATFFETVLTQGGRGKGPTFSMYRRMAVKHGVWGHDFVPLDLLDGSLRWPGGASPYFFGYLLYEDLWKRKKADGIRQFVTKTSRAFPPYFINGPIESVYGADYPSLWSQIFERTGSDAKKEIEDIERQPLSKLSYLTDTKFHKWDVVAFPDGQRLAYRSSTPDRGSTLEILSLNSRDKDQSIELESGRQEGMCLTQLGAKSYLVFAETEFDNGYILNVLRVFDVENNKKITPKHKGDPISRVHSVGCASDGRILTYQEVSTKGVVREWRLGSEFNEAETVREWPVPEGEWVTSLIATNPPRIASRRATSTAIYEWPNGKSPSKTWELPGHYHHFAPDLTSGDWPVVGSSSGREEVWLLNPNKKTARKAISVLGGVNSFAKRGDKWWVASYRHGGYDIAEASPINSGSQSLKSITPVEKSNGKVSMGEMRSYSPWSSLWPRGWVPSMLIVPDGAQFSVFIPGFDIAQKHVYNLFGGYDTRGSPFFLAQYAYRFGRSQQLDFEASFLPGYIISSRDFLKQWGASIGWSTRLGTNLPTISLSAIYRKLEPSRLGPANQSVGFGAGIAHSFWRRTAAKAIAPLRSTRLSLSHSQYFKEIGSNDNYYITQAGFDQYLSTPWYKWHILKLSGRFGYTYGTPFYNSFFQGGGELLFSMGRGTYLNRGFLPGIFGSQKIMTWNLDYLFPVVEVERGWNQWPFFLKRLDGALTFDLTTLGKFQYYYASAGLELKSQWKLFYYVPSVIRVGFYHGFGKFGEPFYFTTAFEASL